MEGAGWGLLRVEKRPRGAVGRRARGTAEQEWKTESPRPHLGPEHPPVILGPAGWMVRVRVRTGGWD